jgi:hypothetical protein
MTSSQLQISDLTWVTLEVCHWCGMNADKYFILDNEATGAEPLAGP